MAALLAFVLASVIVAARWSSIDPSGAPEAHPFVSLYDPPVNAAEVMLNVGDGQAFAAIAQDPTFARPTVFNSFAPGVSQEAEAAYRAQRPLFGWLGWLASAGRPAAVPVALMALTVLGAALLTAAAGLLATVVRRRGDLATLAVLAPGSVAVLAHVGPEGLATGLAALGVLLWTRSPRSAVLLLTMAVLARETLVLFPLALGIVELSRGRRRGVWPLLVPAGTWLVWLVVVHARLGAWPSEGGTARLALPFAGLLEGMARWSVVDACLFAAGAVLAVAAVARLRGVWRFVAVAHLALAAVMGPEVWAAWEGFGRVLLPLHLLGIVALLPRAAAVERRLLPEAPTGGRHDALLRGLAVGR